MPYTTVNPEAYHPIIYIRGYAMNESDIDETTADPFCGFNVGSTVYRARPSPTPPARFVFESPVMRLVSDHGYSNVISQGTDLTSASYSGTISRRSIVVHHYYDQASSLLGDGQTPPIETFAADLAALIQRMTDHVLVGDNAGDNGYKSRDDFRCYLVAHSMGGLVARTFLQGIGKGFDVKLRDRVLKLFTYATPHNGIDVLGINVPAFLKPHGINTFDRAVMAQYLNLKQYDPQSKDPHKNSVAWMPKSCMDAGKIFTLIGTNRQDYEVALGLSRTFVGKGSDGLVRIQNADLTGFDETGKDQDEPCAKAFTFRSHSGFFGIVNSEEGYQNLQRFLFGNYRVDVWLDVNNVTLPTGDLAKADAEGTLDASYPVELLVSLRNNSWYLTRRVAVEDSAAVVEHHDLRDANRKPTSVTKLLSTIFMADWAKIDPGSDTVSYRLQLGVLMPDFQINKADASDSHYEGSKIFSGAAIIELNTKDPDHWTATYYWESEAPGSAQPPNIRPLGLVPDNKGHLVAAIPVSSGGAVQLNAQIRFIVTPWQ
ncbi:hypothetical protein LMG27952_07707 [Paraburkholderia hiiakae]|uniref:PGAP1-like protein n=1 Tax=Paraburkholderia hiiakae TaxID=1081782 RepID=A0ABM8PBN8_9BURK|nr:hypothetical protein [Paraburkholderia hiiakae]CAD6562182.1 hypothetical protein LMG27952_07707 [Paraburkholderia hiiakae]